MYFTLNTIGQNSPENLEDRIISIKNIMNHPKVIELFIGFNMPKVSWKTKVAILLIKFKMARLYNYMIIPKSKM